MVIDTSALVAILTGEDDAARYADAMLSDTVFSISAVTLFETQIVVEARLGDVGATGLDRLLRDEQIEVVPVDYTTVITAREAWRRFGKGRHPAALNLGDCFSYALAKGRDEPLLFKGRDFTQTDVAAVIS